MPEEEIKVLDHGFIELVRIDGVDTDITDAARLSYSKGTKSVNKDQGLINYLMRNRHTSPTEMVGLVFHCKMPIFVARQWVRHRTASLNEMSARYSILPNEYYLPTVEVLAEQSKTNNQGRENKLLPEEYTDYILKLMKENCEKAYLDYRYMLNDKEDKAYRPEDPSLARELARSILPVAFYTEWIWRIDLHNLFHFLGLRLDSHAQYEIRVYAEAIAEIVKKEFPMSWSAFKEYRLDAVTFSGKEMDCIKTIWKQLSYDDNHTPDDFSEGEWREFLKKVS